MKLVVDGVDEFAVFRTKGYIFWESFAPAVRQLETKGIGILSPSVISTSSPSSAKRRGNSRTRGVELSCDFRRFIYRYAEGAPVFHRLGLRIDPNGLRLANDLGDVGIGTGHPQATQQRPSFPGIFWKPAWSGPPGLHRGHGQR